MLLRFSILSAELLRGKITYLFVLLEEECKTYQSRGDSCFGPREGLSNIKAKVVRFFCIFLRLIQSSYVFLNKLSFDRLFHRFLDHYDKHDL